MQVRVAQMGITEVHGLVNKAYPGYPMLLFTYSSQGLPLHNELGSPLTVFMHIHSSCEVHNGASGT